MAAPGSADHWRGPTACSLCRGHCQDPVIRPCGHLLCPACIRRPWRDVIEQITCPWCKEEFQGGESGSHAWAGEEIDEQFLLEDPAVWLEGVCAAHNKELNFFCVEDQSFICGVCREARSHKHHTVVPRKEAETDRSQDLRRSRGGWESFPSSRPTSVANGDVYVEELAADRDPEGLKGAPAFSRVQTLMVWTVLLLFLIAIGGLSATIFAFARAAVKPGGADPRPSAALRCPEGWFGTGGNCYYFSKDERTWESSRNYCSAHAASLAVNGSLEDVIITLHRKGPSNHWVGLRREPGQPWRWVDGAAFDHPLAIRGAGLCAYLANGVVSSSGCDTEKKWACSKPDGQAGATQGVAEC